ncbi:hypothetical protein [Desulfosoma caldarium]|uniref:ParB family chromosome partitioning protein n=1 Tax=Desulfosoma caldarium TaxID=610254 RepID=A0A3N1UQC3_9BACT|nr:hypothetical protein [Desulfosoma caldarium]ROQ90737.1 ParB family chromosome partitioning protein [Desulfosoma caldarium]
MESATLASVSLSKIDWHEDAFAIPGYVPDEALERSLEREGILVPPTLWEKAPQHFVIVDGFKRLFWLKARADRVHALIYPEASSETELLKLRLETKMFSRTLNLAERAQVLAKYASLSSKEELQRRIGPTLGLSGTPKTLALWCSIAAWPSRHLSFLAHDGIAEKTALLLAPFPEADRDAFLQLMQVLRCSASLQVEILERCNDIAHRDGVSLQWLLQSQEIQAILKDGDRNRREKTAAVRDLLSRWRYPRLVKKMTAMQRAIDQIPLPATASLTPPPYLEGDVWELKLRFRTPEELAASVETCASLFKTPAFYALFRLLDHSTAYDESTPAPPSPGNA